MTDKTKEKKISKKDLEYISKKIKDIIAPEFTRKRQVFYFRDRESKVFKSFDVADDEVEFIHPETEESFRLSRPVLYNGEIPVYWAMREETKEIDFEVVFNKENNKIIYNEVLINPTEMLAAQSSSARTSILKRDKLSFSQAIITILCCLITALTVYIVCAPFMTAGNIPTNSTTGV